MSALDKHVDVQISKETATVSRLGFGTPAILTYHTRFPEVCKLYGSLTEMVDDGWVPANLAYKMAAAMFAQSPRPTQVVVGRRTTPHLRTVNLTPSASLLANTAYWVRVSDELFSFTTDATPTAAEITAGLTALINAGTENVKATDNTTDLDIARADSPGGTPTAGSSFYIEFDPSQFAFVDNTVDVNIATELANLRACNDEWYGLVADAWGADEIDALATAIESAGPKLYIAETQDSDVIGSGSGDIATTLQTASLDRTAIIYSADLDPSPAAAWLGKQLPLTPGASTWKFSTLATVATSELTTAAVANADGKNCNTYTRVGGNGMTAEGVLASSEFIDVTRFIDWLTARIKEDVFAALLTASQTGKVPFTDAGIQGIVGVVEGVLRQGVANGGLNGDEDLIVTAPRAADVSSQDRASRILPDVEFIATLAGAIHKVIIRGKVVA